jgi:hypothetical protein
VLLAARQSIYIFKLYHAFLYVHDGHCFSANGTSGTLFCASKLHCVQTKLHPSTREFVEKLFVQRLIGFFRAHRQENVAADELVHHFAIGRQAAEDNVLLLELHHHVLHLPVHIPSLQTKCKQSGIVIR